MKIDVLISDLCDEVDQLKEDLKAQTQRSIYWREKYREAVSLFNNGVYKPAVKVDLVDPELNKFMTEFYCK